MKIYFDGCSWTYGGELEEEHRESQRFSRLVCEELGAEEYNISKGGASNNRIVRQLLVENNISDYDLAIIQMTYPSRTEYYDKKWKGITIQDTPLWNPKTWINKRYVIDHEDFWTYYYSKIYDEYYGSVYENISAITIRNHCKVNNVKLILTTINKNKEMKFDFDLDNKRYPRASGYHPNKDGHRLIAENLLELV
tara:strand:- start:189 stop:773 length:585 start_codon:yes stop_codon:yes gene_type:complete